MATTLGPFNSTIILFYVAGVPVAHTSDYTFKFDNALVDATTRNSNGYAENIPGLRKWSATCAGVVAYDDVTGFMTFLQAISNRTPIVAKFSTGITGDYFYSGTMRISSVSQAMKMETTSTWSGTLEGTGALTIGIN